MIVSVAGGPITTVRSTMGSSECGQSQPSTPKTRHNSDDHVRHRRRLRARRPGHVDAVLAQRQKALDAAYRVHPERFPKKPSVPKLSREDWINPPEVGGSDVVGDFHPAPRGHNARSTAMLIPRGVR